MRILISTDAEGISWTTHGSQVHLDERDYQIFREIYTAEINALVEGFTGDAEIFIADSHDTGRNILFNKLHPSAKLITGTPRPFSMVQGIQMVDALFLFGYHSRAGTISGVLNHTYSKLVHRLIVNGMELGEIGLSAAVAGKFGKPVLLVAGDSAAIDEATEILKDCEFIVLKEGISRYSSITYSLDYALKVLKEGTRNAIKRKGDIFRVNEPVHLEIEFSNTGMADYASLIPGFERKDGYTVTIVAQNIIDAYRYFRVAVTMASGDHGGY